MIIYLLKVILIQAICFGCYFLLLRPSHKHHWNRWFLLASLTIPFAIPLCKISIPVHQPTSEVVNQVVAWVDQPLQDLDKVPISVKPSISWHPWPFIKAAYVLVSTVLLLRIILFLGFIRKLKRHSQCLEKQLHHLYKTEQAQPFSFFFNVFIPEKLLESKDFDQILYHEFVHARQLHSLDRLLVDFLISLFWFNPFMYLYRKALIEIHEYQADEAVIRNFGDPIGYQEVLFSQLQTAGHSNLVSHFNFSTIKKRIVMMNKPKTNVNWRHVIAASCSLAAVLIFSSSRAIEPLKNAEDNFSYIIGPSVGFEVKNTTNWLAQLDEYIPSIFPLAETEKVKLTSGFGMRKDPFTQEMRKHNGVDFSAPEGTEVLATANGKVLFAGEDGNHGLRVDIAHGDQYRTRYDHLSSIDVQKGEEVKKGQTIAKSGNTGASTAPHLHYEVIKLKEGHVDPELYIKDFLFNKEQTDKSKQTGYSKPIGFPFNIPSEELNISSGFGYRMDPILKTQRPHHGVDYRVPTGTAVVATGSGKVELVANSISGYGNQIIIDHGNDVRTRFAHLSTIAVSEGDFVQQGEIMAKSGNSGKSTYPHLHYEIIIDDKAIDPITYITSNQ